MLRSVAIVTDSTASIPVDVTAEWGITVIQLDLRVGDESNDERRVPHPELARALRDGVEVETSPPPSAAFFWNYMDAANAGAQAIVSVHLSGALSETCAAARAAAAEIKIPVYVVDSGLCGLGLGYAVLAAARAAATGAGVRDVLNVVRRRVGDTTQLIYVDTLEYLRNGGRISRSQATVGQALSIKPLLTLQNGAIERLTQGFGADRTLKKAVAEGARRAGSGPVDIGVEHFESADRAQEVLDALRSAIPQVQATIVERTSAIVGAHVGPGALGVTISPV
jgi:DegV family protein with EDD domain